MRPVIKPVFIPFPRLFALIFSGLLLMGITLLNNACTPKNQPRNFKAGEHKCEYCMMGISDMRFRGQVISPKGKSHYFDSIECLTSWSQDQPKSVHSLWVGDFFHKGKWLDYSKAHILYSSKLNSPMGAGLSAYPSEEDLARAKQLYKGQALTKKQLREHVANWRKEL